MTDDYQGIDGLTDEEIIREANYQLGFAQRRVEILTRERDEAYEALHAASEAHITKDDAKLSAMLCHRDARANATGEYQTQRARAEKAEATLDEWRKAYSRNILSHDEEEDDEAAHLHAVACADQAMREGDQ